MGIFITLGAILGVLGGGVFDGDRIHLGKTRYFELVPFVAEGEGGELGVSKPYHYILDLLGEGGLGQELSERLGHIVPFLSVVVESFSLFIISYFMNRMISLNTGYNRTCTKIHTNSFSLSFPTALPSTRTMFLPSKQLADEHKEPADYFIVKCSQKGDHQHHHR